MPQKDQKGSILIWLIVIFLIVSLLGGGLYYFLEIYSPAQYAKAVVPIYDEIKSQNLRSGNSTRSDNYEDILIFLDEFQSSLTQINVKLSNLKPSPIKSLPPFLANTKRSQQIHEDFTKALEILLSNIDKSKEQFKKKAQFMVKAKQLILLLRPDLKTYPPPAVPAGQGEPLPPPPNTAGEFLSVWEGRIPQAKIVAQELFSEPQDLGEVSFDELKLLWLETEQGFDVIIPFLKKQDPNLSLRDAQKLVLASDRPMYDKVDKIDEFLPLLEKVLIKNSAENIIKSQFILDNDAQSELNLRTKRLDEAIKDIRKKYKI